MNKYINGKIYKLIDNTNNNIYIGSTIQTLKKRLNCHIKHNNNNSSNLCSGLIIKNGDYQIILIEDYPCNNKRELEFREQYYIDNNKCINIKNAYTDQKEYNKEYFKEYRIKNKDNLKKKKKEYQNKNKDKLKVYLKEYNYYKNSWCGDKRYNNNLLEIDINIFN